MVTEEIRKGVQALFPEGSLVELRIPKSSQGTIIGFFRDREKLVQVIEEYSGKVPAVYYTLNAPPSESYDKSQKDKAVVGGHGCKDDEIVVRNWLLIDCDPLRVDGNGTELPQQTVSSTGYEKSDSFIVARKVEAYLQDKGWPDPVTADSGNGYHLLYNMGGMPSTDELTVTVQEALQHLAEKFDTSLVHVDTVVYNPSRITKAYGSLASKGPNTADRPHRYSCILSVPTEIKPITLMQLSALKPIPKEAKKSSIVIKAKAAERIATTDGPEKMEEFLDWYGIAHKVMRREKNGWKFVIVPCPFNEEHNNGEVAVFVNDDGGYGFKCFHSHCQDKDWRAFRDHLESISGKKFFFKTNLPTVISPDEKTTSKISMKRASTIAPEVLTWLWPKRIPFGKLTLFVGHPGIGKGMATMYVTACASKGSGWHDCKNTNEPVEVIIASSEDAAKDTLIPRLMAAGADMDKVIIMDKVGTDKGDKEFTLDTDLPALRSTLESNPDVKVIIIDPIMNHLGHLKGNSEQEVRMALSPLAKIAEKFGIAIILVTHYNKSNTMDSIQRVGGAMGMVGAVRIAWAFGEDKLDGKRKMLPLKANISPDTGGLEYTTVNTEVEINGQFEDIGRIVFGDITHASTESALKTLDKEAFVPPYKQCMNWLVEHLADGELHLKVDVYKSAEAMGFGNAEMSMARQKLGATVKYIQSKDIWYLQIEPKHEEEEHE
jgi:hypothetical protein